MALRYKQEKSSEHRTDGSARVIRWARAVIGDDENTSVSLGGRECDHAACGGKATVILLMRPDEPTIGIKISKSVEAVTQADVAAAFQRIQSPRA